MRIDWVWLAPPGYLVSITGIGALGPLEYTDLRRCSRLRHWLLRALLRENESCEIERLRKALDVLVACDQHAWERALASAEICCPGNELYSFKVTRDMLQ